MRSRYLPLHTRRIILGHQVDDEGVQQAQQVGSPLPWQVAVEHGLGKLQNLQHRRQLSIRPAGQDFSTRYLET